MALAKNSENLQVLSQLAITCSKLTFERQEQDMKYL